ncbi:hypothetical protein [Ralstonia solanacearum]|uniref:hypothetical protein n=1 Tax=Ralstonia solanacearum TaxID=305 RepID=UPI0005ABFAC8|nr:hypothetical protein [Ralstonia solanacearum]MDC6177097.1 hypothetical protein [Ralstonia solanacearum]MDC6238371.1 hypothetical protein [Ralstonia solanacearum]
MVKRIGALIASALMIGSVPALAVDAHHPETASDVVATPTTKNPPATAAKSADAEKRFEQARQQMKKTLAQMDKIHQTKDPKERQRLMAEHMQTMRETMQSMHGTGGPMMMEVMGGQGMMGGAGAPGMGGPGMTPDQRMNMMENRMDMMQMMMEQMLQQQDRTKSP